jgi:hypothetical protein
VTDLSVRLTALRDDAKQWGLASQAMHQASEMAKAAELGIGQFGQVAQNCGLVSTYQSLQQEIVKALAGASTEFDRMDKTLIAAAQTYQNEDEQGKHAFNQIGPR